MPEQSPTWSREGGKLLREEIKIRLALSLLLVVFLFAGRAATTDSMAVILATVLMVGTLLISQFASKTERSAGAQQFQLSAVALAVLDLIVVTLLLRGTGGLHSGFFSLYLVSLVFAAAFFQGLELALLTALAMLLYVGVSIHYIDSPANLWHMSARLIGLIVVSWYSYSLSRVLHREKENNDQLLRHLTEGVMLFDREQRVSLVNATLLQMIGEVPDVEIVGRKRDELAARDRVLSWLLGDVGETEQGYKTRIGCFPEAGLPLIECTTIPCVSESDTGGWVVVCKDLRDLKTETKNAKVACDKLAPLSNLRALSEALYGMAEYLDDQRRWQAVEVIEKHTLALQSILADMLHQGGREEDTSLDLGFIDVSSLLSSTRRLLEIQPVGDGMDIDIFCEQGLPEINVDRGRLGQCLLQLCKGLMVMGTADDKLIVDVRNAERNVIFSLEVVPKLGEGEPGGTVSEAELAKFAEMCDLPVFEIIEEHQGHWECRPDSSHYRRVVFELPISGPSHMDEQAVSDGKRVSIPARGIALPLEPSLAAEITNQLKNTMSVIRGYAEMALESSEPQRQTDALQYALELSDQASELVETLQPSCGDFDLEVKVTPEEAEAAAAATPSLPSPPSDGAILVVDDDASMRGLMVDVLQSAGYSTIQANDGRQAVERLRMSRPVMAFVDLSMPRVTGVEVMREARKYAPEMPVVLMTGYATQVAVEALGEEKPYAILAKPFTMIDVLSLAKAVVGDQAAKAG
jgi:CheY-like chemotaxis protein